MTRIISKQDYNKERSEHQGLSKYKIFKKDNKGSQIIVHIFWAASDDAAKNELDIFLKKKQLVDPNDTSEYFYGSSGGYISDLGNGMYKESDSFSEDFEKYKKESIWKRIYWFFMRIYWWFRDIKYMFVDFWFWFKHYDKKTNKSHQRYESWNLDSAILDMLEFNIPIIKDDKMGVPTAFCIKARQKIHENELNFDAEESYRLNPNVDDKTEMPIARAMWNAELDNLLHHIWLYRFYSDYGIVDQTDNLDYLTFIKAYESTIPYKEGTDKDIDYSKILELTQNEWNAIWSWMSQYGQMLWT